jgi:hypothetical protein
MNPRLSCHPLAHVLTSGGVLRPHPPSLTRAAMADSDCRFRLFLAPPPSAARFRRAGAGRREPGRRLPPYTHRAAVSGPHTAPGRGTPRRARSRLRGSGAAAGSVPLRAAGRRQGPSRSAPCPHRRPAGRGGQRRSCRVGPLRRCRPARCAATAGTADQWDAGGALPPGPHPTRPAPDPARSEPVQGEPGARRLAVPERAAGRQRRRRRWWWRRRGGRRVAQVGRPAGRRLRRQPAPAAAAESAPQESGPAETGGRCMARCWAGSFGHILICDQCFDQRSKML